MYATRPVYSRTFLSIVLRSARPKLPVCLCMLSCAFRPTKPLHTDAPEYPAKPGVFHLPLLLRFVTSRYFSWPWNFDSDLSCSVSSANALRTAGMSLFVHHRSAIVLWGLRDRDLTFKFYLIRFRIARVIYF